MSTKNLGFVKAIHRGLTSPTNTEMIWYNLVDNFHYYYDVVLLNWVRFMSGSDSVKSTNDKFIITHSQLISDSFTLQLRNNIAPESFVLVTTGNELGGVIDPVKISFIAGARNVTIQNDLYFDFEEGDEIVIYYFYLTGDTVPIVYPITLETFSSVVSNNNITWTLKLANPNSYSINAHVNLQLDSGVIEEYVIPIDANSETTYSRTYINQSVGSHILYLTGDVTDNDTAIIVAPIAPVYVYSNFIYTQNINSEIVSVDITNTGDMEGLAGCWFKLDSGTPIHKGLNPIAIDQKITFQHTFTALSSGSHTVYAYEEDGITLIDSSTITIPIIAQPATVYCAENWDVIATKEKNEFTGRWSPYTLRVAPLNNGDYIGTDIYPTSGHIKQGRQLLKFGTTNVLNCVTAKLKMLVKISSYTSWNQSYFDIYESTCIDNTIFDQVWGNMSTVELLSSISTETDANYPGYYVVVFTLNALGVALINTGVPVKLLMVDISEFQGLQPAKLALDLIPIRSYNPRLILTY